jgi:putative ABC transport system permease protein
MDPGFQTAHLAVFPASPGQAGYGKAQAKQYYEDVRNRAARVPGVETVSWASNMPLWSGSANGIQIEGRQGRDRADQIRAVLNTVDRNYFETAGVVLVGGRAFSDIDQEASLPVAVVNQKMAQDYWPAGALGHRLQVPGEKKMRVVVGIARTANYTSWGESPQPCIYLPLAQADPEAMVLYVRTKADPREILAPVEREMRAAAPQILLFGIRTGGEIIDGGLFQARMGVGLLATFGLLALGLASIGLYGVMAYSVNQRRREIGLRMALGATPGSVLGMVIREGMSLVLAGVLIGFAAAALVGRLLSRMLFGVSASDPLSLGGAALVLSAIALFACYLPARGATRVDPLEALREA